MINPAEGGDFHLAKTGDFGVAVDNRRDREVEQLRARAERAEAELVRTKAALEIVGKAHALLEMLSESTNLPKRPR